jgi:hypothetical protein
MKKDEELKSYEKLVEYGWELTDKYGDAFGVTITEEEQLQGIKLIFDYLEEKINLPAFIQKDYFEKHKHYYIDGSYRKAVYQPINSKIFGKMFREIRSIGAIPYLSEIVYTNIGVLYITFCIGNEPAQFSLYSIEDNAIMCYSYNANDDTVELGDAATCSDQDGKLLVSFN